MTGPPPEPVRLGERMREPMARLFLSSCGIILVVTAAAKLLSATGDEPLLESFDPVFGLTLRELFTYTGAVEGAVGLRCFWGDRLRRPAALVLWLSGMFVLYRSGLFWLGSTGSCGCLGVFTARLGLTPAAVDTTMKILLGYLLVGSGAVLLLLRGQKSKPFNWEPVADDRRAELPVPSG